MAWPTGPCIGRCLWTRKRFSVWPRGLGGTPRRITEIPLDLTSNRLDIDLDFPAGTRFPRPSDGKLCPVYDSCQRSWRHLNFFQFECHLNAPVPRIDGGDPDGVKTVSVPWARPGSGFTLLMESLMVLMAGTGMTVAEAARTLAVTDHRFWRVLFHYVKKAHSQIDVSEVIELTVDETSVRRGHNYVTVVCEPARPDQDQPTRVLAVTEGKDAQAVVQAAAELHSLGMNTQAVEHVCADMSPAFAKGIAQAFPNARLVFDYFHVVGLLTRAIDKVRRRESRLFPELLKGTRYLWLTNQENLSQEKRALRQQLCRSKLQTAKAHAHLAAFQDLLRAENPQEAIEGLKWWHNWVCHSRIPEMIHAAKSIKRHWDGIVAYLETRLTNGPAEAVNGLIQNAKRKAREFRSFEYFRTVIYLIGSHLTFNLPSPVPAADPHQTS